MKRSFKLNVVDFRSIFIVHRLTQSESEIGIHINIIFSGILSGRPFIFPLSTSNSLLNSEPRTSNSQLRRPGHADPEFSGSKYEGRPLLHIISFAHTSRRKLRNLLSMTPQLNLNSVLQPQDPNCKYFKKKSLFVATSCYKNSIFTILPL